MTGAGLLLPLLVGLHRTVTGRRGQQASSPSALVCSCLAPVLHPHWGGPSVAVGWLVASLSLLAAHPACHSLQNSGLKDIIDPGTFYMVCNTSALPPGQDAASSVDQSCKVHFTLSQVGGGCQQGCGVVATARGGLPGRAMKGHRPGSCMRGAQCTPGRAHAEWLAAARSQARDNPVTCTASECAFRANSSRVDCASTYCECQTQGCGEGRARPAAILPPRRDATLQRGALAGKEPAGQQTSRRHPCHGACLALRACAAHWALRGTPRRCAARAARPRALCVCVRRALHCPAAAVQNILDDVEGKPCTIDCAADGTCSFNIQVGLPAVLGVWPARVPWCAHLTPLSPLVPAAG